MLKPTNVFYTMEYDAAERKKELLPFTTAGELESIMLSEISQVVKGNYHMISHISGTCLTKLTSEQKRTRHTDIKNKLTWTRGDWGANGGKTGNMFKGPMDKSNGKGIVFESGGCMGQGRATGGNGDNCNWTIIQNERKNNSTNVSYTLMTNTMCKLEKVNHFQYLCPVNVPWLNWYINSSFITKTKPEITKTQE